MLNAAQVNLLARAQKIEIKNVHRSKPLAWVRKVYEKHQQNTQAHQRVTEDSLWQASIVFSAGMGTMLCACQMQQRITKQDLVLQQAGICKHVMQPSMSCSLTPSAKHCLCRLIAQLKHNNPESPGAQEHIWAAAEMAITRGCREASSMPSISTTMPTSMQSKSSN